jgi:hypothetical protein
MAAIPIGQACGGTAMDAVLQRVIELIFTVAESAANLQQTLSSRL